MVFSLGRPTPEDPDNLGAQILIRCHFLIELNYMINLFYYLRVNNLWDCKFHSTPADQEQ